MVQLSELLSITLVLLTVWTALIYNISHVLRGLARRHSVCAESIFSLPITYIACFVLLREESFSAIATIYLTVVTVNFSYMKLGRWSTKDWLMRILSIVTTVSIFIVYFAFVGLSNVAKNANSPQLGLSPVEFDLRFYHVPAIFFTSWRFTLVSFILMLAIFPRKRHIVKVKSEKKFGCSIKLMKLLLLWLKIGAIWGILKGTNKIRLYRSPWSDVDRVLLDDNSLQRVTFAVITFLMACDIFSAVTFNDKDKLYDWDEWIASIRTKNEKWGNKFLGALLASKEDEIEEKDIRLATKFLKLMASSKGDEEKDTALANMAKNLRNVIVSKASPLNAETSNAVAIEQEEFRVQQVQQADEISASIP